MTVAALMAGIAATGCCRQPSPTRPACRAPIGQGAQVASIAPTYPGPDVSGRTYNDNTFSTHREIEFLADGTWTDQLRNMRQGGRRPGEDGWLRIDGTWRRTSVDTVLLTDDHGRTRRCVFDNRHLYVPQPDGSEVRYERGSFFDWRPHGYD